MSRKAKLKKALAFDDDKASKAVINGRPIIFNNETLKFREAASWENARLASLHAALIEAVEALEWVTKNYLGDIKIECSRALSEIDKVLEEK